jgi:hypothetical protein
MYKLYIKDGEEWKPAIQGGLHVLTTNISSQEAIAWLAEARKHNGFEMEWKRI